MAVLPTPTSLSAAQETGGTPPRLYLPDHLTEDGLVVVSPEQARYLVSVMRRTPGSRVRLFNGKDGEFEGHIEQTGREFCRVKVGTRLRPQVEENDLWLVFALLKRAPTDMVVQKATEMGVSVILPVFTTRTNADRTNIMRLRSIATEAAEQSERMTVPVVHEPRALSAVLAQWPTERRLVACLERQEAPPVRPAETPLNGLLVGPEGGFTTSELDALRACTFVEPASLGKRILRAETAAIVGLARIQAD